MKVERLNSSCVRREAVILQLMLHFFSVGRLPERSVQAVFSPCRRSDAATHSLSVTLDESVLF